MTGHNAAEILAYVFAREAKRTATLLLWKVLGFNISV